MRPASGVRCQVSGDRVTLLERYEYPNQARAKFGGVEASVNASQVETILDGQVDTPWLIQNAKWLAILAIVVATLVILLIAWAAIRALGHRRAVAPA